MSRKSIGIVCNYRVGSTNIVRNMAAKEKLPNRWEIFNDCRGFLATAENLREKNDNSHIDRIMRQIEQCPCVFKVMGDQLLWDMQHIHRLAKCTEFVYLYRRDWQAQVKSWVAWIDAGDRGHRYGKVKEYHIDVTQEFFDDQAHILKRNYEFMEQVFAAYPGDKMCLEDFPVQKPYDRRYTWSRIFREDVTYDTKRLDRM